MSDEIIATVTVPERQTVHALALRTPGFPWWTTGLSHSQDLTDQVGFWKRQGYEVRILTAEVPI